MKLFLLLMFCTSFLTCAAQNNPSMPPLSNRVSLSFRDSLNIREKLIQLAILNSDVQIDEANVNIAKYNLKKAKASWFDQVNISANVNEFVIKGSDAANYFPKYNLGLNIPLGIFQKHSNDVKIAQEIITINELTRNEKIKKIRTEVLTKYENYLEKKQVLELQMEITEEEYTLWLKAQKDYKVSGQMDDLNKAYKNYNSELSKQRSAERDLRVAYIELEEVVGFRLDEILSTDININK
jgi:outer membrane protein TolC